MRMRLSLIAGALALAACNGPKDTCDGSFESYFSMLESHQWDGMYEMLTPEFKKKIAAARFAAGMEQEWLGSKSFSKKVMNTSLSGKLCIVNGEMSYVTKIRGKEPVSTDNDYFSWTFRQQNDGKWYIELPGMEKVSGF